MMRIVVLITLIVISPVAIAQKGHPISTGIVYPSDNSAVIENGSRLPVSESQAELLFGTSPNEDKINVEGTMVGSAAIFGYGLGIDYLGSDSILALGGFGVGGNSLGAGLNARYDVEAKRADFDLGIYKGGALMDLALVARNVDEGVSRLVLGLGHQNNTGVKLEGDIEFSPDDGFTDFDPALSVALGDLGVAVGYRIPLQGSSGGKFRFGGNYWISQQNSLEFLYNFRLAEYVIGFKAVL